MMSVETQYFASKRKEKVLNTIYIMSVETQYFASLPATIFLY